MSIETIQIRIEQKEWIKETYERIKELDKLAGLKGETMADVKERVESLIAYFDRSIESSLNRLDGNESNESDINLNQS